MSVCQMRKLWPQVVELRGGASYRAWTLSTLDSFVTRKQVISILSDQRWTGTEQEHGAARGGSRPIPGHQERLPGAGGDFSAEEVGGEDAAGRGQWPEDPRREWARSADQLMMLTLTGELGRARPCRGRGPWEHQRGAKLGRGMMGEAFSRPRPGSAPALAPTACLSPLLAPSTLGTSCMFVISLPLWTEESSGRWESRLIGSLL